MLHYKCTDAVYKKTTHHSRKVFDTLVNCIDKDVTKEAANNFLGHCIESQPPIKLLNPKTYDRKLLENLIIEEFEKAFNEPQKPYLKYPYLTKHYLLQQAPLRLLDGGWLSKIPKYYWENCAEYEKKSISILSNIFFEELGEGKQEINHHFLYNKLLQQAGFNLPSIELLSNEANLWDESFYQAAIQLSFAYCEVSKFFPELLGYTLAFEMISADTIQQQKAMNNLNLDDTYHKLHISIDNPTGLGHTKVSLEAVFEYMQEVIQFSSSPNEYLSHWERICKGFALCTWDPLKNTFQEMCNNTTDNSSSALDKLMNRLIISRAKYATICHNQVLLNGGNNLGVLFSKINSAKCDCEKLYYAENILSKLKETPNMIQKLSSSSSSKPLLLSACESSNAKMYKVFDQHEIEIITCFCEQYKNKQNINNNPITVNDTTICNKNEVHSQEVSKITAEVSKIIAKLAKYGKGRHKRILINQHDNVDALLDENPNEIIDGLRKANKLCSFMKGLDSGGVMCNVISKKDLYLLKSWYNLGAPLLPEGQEVEKEMIERKKENIQSKLEGNCCYKELELQKYPYNDNNNNNHSIILPPIPTEETNYILESMRKFSQYGNELTIRCDYFLKSKAANSNNIYKYSLPISSNNLKEIVENLGSKFKPFKWHDPLRQIDGYSFTTPVQIWRPTKLGLACLALAKQKWQSEGSLEAALTDLENYREEDIKEAVAFQFAVTNSNWNKIRKAALIALALWRTIIVTDITEQTLYESCSTNILTYCFLDICKDKELWNSILSFLELLCKAIHDTDTTKSLLDNI